MKSVVVGVSGGVDSAVCAARLKNQGYKVTGVYLNFSGAAGTPGAAGAREVCAALDIPFVSADARDSLERLVITPFVDSYCECETPSPCIICNSVVKFPILAKTADELGAEYIATGHYAGVTKRGSVFYLTQGIPERDQSYMLYRLPQRILKRCVFPIGNTPKNEVRAEAAALGLTVAETPDSMEICFIPDVDYSAFIQSRGRGMPEGDIVDTSGAVLGRHNGLHNYTIGQRRGLGVSSAGRLFVVALDNEENRVVLGDNNLLYRDRIKLRDMILNEIPEGEVDVKVRHSRQSYPAVVQGDTVIFTDRPARAPTPGQSAVFYRDGLVLGGGVIVR